MLYLRVESLPQLRTAFLEYLKKAGARIVSPPDDTDNTKREQAKTPVDEKTQRANVIAKQKAMQERENQIVPNLIKFTKRLNALVANSFQSDTEFAYALKQVIVNIQYDLIHDTYDILYIHSD
jgi:hypothetical protein